MRDHLSDEMLAAYLIDAASDEEIEVLEAHVGTCERCAHRLAREAQLEETLREVARRTAVEPRTTWSRRRWAGAALALAAGLALWIGWPREAPQEAAAPPERPVCDRLPAHCERPTRHGLVSTTPVERDAIPRYEDLAPTPMASEPLVPRDRNNL